MHYIQHHSIARGLPLAKTSGGAARQGDSLSGVALVNVLRVEPELGTPSRGGTMATVARRTEEGWRLSGHKIYSTGLPILKWYSVWARTDEAEPRLGTFLVPAGLPGARMVETWDHGGMRASGSHDLILEDVLIPLEYEIDVRPPAGWQGGDPMALIVHGAFVCAIYDGVARAARDWLVTFLQNRKPLESGRGARDAAARAGNSRRHRGEARDQQADCSRRSPPNMTAGRTMSSADANAMKITVTNNAVEAVQEGADADRQPRPVAHQSARAAPARRAVRAGAQPAGRHHQARSRTPRARHSVTG